MNREELTFLQKKIMDEIVIPSISDQYSSRYSGKNTIAEDMNFGVFLEKLKDFYVRYGGKRINWYRLLLEKYGKK